MRATFIRLLLLLAVLVQSPASALESGAGVSSRATVTLVSAQDAARAGDTVDLALHLRLAEGWHIYWMNPGDAGQPPRIELFAPAGSTVSDIRWPTPKRHVDGPVTTFIHEGELLLPFSVTLPAGLEGPQTLTAKAGWLVCKDICIPEEGVFRLTLPAGESIRSAEAVLFDAAGDALPGPARWQAAVSADAVLTLSGPGADAIVDADFLPAEWGPVEHGAPQTLTVADGRAAIAFKPGAAFDPARALSGVLHVRDRDGVARALWVSTPGLAVDRAPSVVLASGSAPPPAPSEATPPSDAFGLAWAVLFALVGGLLLNLMPCVFPVLAIKALSFAQLGGHAQRTVRAQSLAYCAGVVFTFLLLAGVLLALRTAGLQAGWGFQFQSPVFVTAMAGLLFVIGLNLSGVFGFGSGFASAGDALASRPGLSGSFFTGALAVVVATPCTAPFMGGALAFALAAPAAQTVAVFVAMGVGLALPYALLAFVPGLARRMPRPGPWMDRLKQALAFPMYAAAAWLVWVLSQQSGADGVLMALVVLLLLALAGWLLGVAQGGASSAGAWRTGALLAALLATVGIARAPEPAGTGPSAGIAVAGSEPYAPARLSELRAAGRPVFINMTAAWCVTCLMNEKVALSTTGVQQAFATRGITYMKGDWTRSDPLITDFLRQHGRDGVPLYVYFPPDGAPPAVLPQILTEQIVLDRIGS
ncbi:cytochrome C biogenesis transmembrane region family protein [Methyloversatilis sp. RAC08]|uniref:protein-disulfide reductase DsbD family protein n=1 Tax=Methyloversatilis sp. RAC08 TaxID=1842540 RepID=UPI00083D42FF|nr:protein-disulfide reductase DsbD domain-containing protein [Methyloversatilis sp. RAC08]AOF82807.1 cytochrome C biogenesis transmembrane region family protein [Methyloversatilis sp. RAC08]